MEDVLITAALLFARMSTLIQGLPLFGAQGVPKSVPLLTAMMITVLVVPGTPTVHLEGFGEVAYALSMEMALGWMMALSLKAIFSALALASELMSMQTGMGMATLFDPLQKAQNGMLGTLASWLSGLLFFEMGLHHRVLEIVVMSFELIPPGQVNSPLSAAPHLAESVGLCWVIGYQLAGPVLAMVWMVNIFIAVLTKLAPKMNVFFSIGMTVTSVAGIYLLAVSFPWVLRAHSDAMSQAVEGLEQLILLVR